MYKSRKTLSANYRLCPKAQATVPSHPRRQSPGSPRGPPPGTNLSLEHVPMDVDKEELVLNNNNRQVQRSNNNWTSQHQESVPCVCERPVSHLICTQPQCGMSLDGRIRILCPTHPKVMFLQDLEVCPGCKKQGVLRIANESDLVRPDLSTGRDIAGGGSRIMGATNRMDPTGKSADSTSLQDVRKYQKTSTVGRHSRVSIGRGRRLNN